MMDCVDVPNSSGKSLRWRYRMPDGSERWVKAKASDGYIAGVAHGLYMDLVPVGNMNASSSTYYCDYYWQSTSAGRVVYRGFSAASANGGVSCAYAYYAPSTSSAFIGSRLAFRGHIVRAASVEAYKAIVEVTGA